MGLEEGFPSSPSLRDSDRKQSCEMSRNRLRLWRNEEGQGFFPSVSFVKALEPRYQKGGVYCLAFGEHSMESDWEHKALLRRTLWMELYHHQYHIM